MADSATPTTVDAVTLRARRAAVTESIATKQIQRGALLEDQALRQADPADVRERLEALDRELADLAYTEEGLDLAIEHADEQAATDGAHARASARTTLLAAYDEAWRLFRERQAAGESVATLLDVLVTLGAFTSDMAAAFPDRRYAGDQMRIGRLISESRRTLHLGPMAARTAVEDRPWRELLRIAAPAVFVTQDPQFFDAATFDAPPARAFTTD